MKSIGLSKLKHSTEEYGFGYFERSDFGIWDVERVRIRIMAWRYFKKKRYV